MLMVDPARVDVEMMLTSGGLRCPDCAGVLRPWGYARERVVRRLRGLLARIRPRRSSCRACRRTHVLLPVSVLLRRADCVETIGAALSAKAAGLGFRPIATSLGVPEATVRGWLRRFTTHAARWRVFFTKLVMDLDPEPEPISAHESVFGDAVEVIGVAAAAAVRRFGPRPAWQFVAAVTAGQFLSPQPRLG
jgi:transposase-like protein